MLELMLKSISSTGCRINRLPFLIIIILCIIGYIIVGLVSPFIFDIASPFYSTYSFFLEIPFLAFTIMASVNRFHDMDKSGWFALLLLIPIVSFFILIWLLVWKGTEGKNRFGSDLLVEVNSENVVKEKSKL